MTAHGGKMIKAKSWEVTDAKVNAAQELTNANFYIFRLNDRF